MSDLSELSISGRVVQPGDADWDAARVAWNLAVDQRPTAVARRRERRRRRATVLRFAAANGLRVAPRAPGHGARVARLARGHDPDQDRARCAGSRSIARRGPHGSRPACARRAGRGRGAARTASARCPAPRPTSASSATRSAAGSAGSGVATASPATASPRSSSSPPRASSATVDAENDADLFWALRGGGGGYAIVTALHLELLPIAELYAGTLIFPAELGADAIRAYRDWAASAPTRSPRSSASCARRRSPTCPSRCATGRC